MGRWEGRGIRFDDLPLFMRLEWQLYLVELESISSLTSHRVSPFAMEAFKAQ
jgi:hypothetical protein